MSQENYPFDLVKGEEVLKYYKAVKVGASHVVVTNKRVVVYESDLMKMGSSCLSIYLKSIIGVRFTVRKGSLGDVFLVTLNGNPIELNILDANSARDITHLINDTILGR